MCVCVITGNDGLNTFVLLMFSHFDEQSCFAEPVYH